MEVLARIVLSEVIGHGLAVFLGLNHVLALFGFVESALGAFAFPGDGDFFIGGERWDRQQTDQRNNGGEFFHTFIHLVSREQK